MAGHCTVPCAMPSDPKSHARAAMLAGWLVTTPLPDAELVRQIRVPAIHVSVRRERPPLDLDAPIYRCRVSAGGVVTVIDEPVGARSCHVAHRRHSQ
jgi:hypothetical protein